VSKTVEQVGQMNLTGNIIPANWFKTLRFPNGKPHVNAILVLSDIVYWYRPIEMRDELTGQFRGFRKKFSKDKLQRSYSAIADLFGLSKRQVKEAMDFLEDEKRIIIREFRTVDTEAGRLNNVLFIDLNIEELHKATYDETYPLLRSNVGGSCIQTDHPPTLERGTNTEITTEIKKDRLIDSGKAREAPSSQPQSSDGMPFTVPGAVQEEISLSDCLGRIEECYVGLRGKFMNDKDYKAAVQLIKSGIPLQTILDGIVLAFENKKKSQDSDWNEIRSLAYCAKAVRQLHYERTARAKALQDLEQFVPDQEPAQQESAATAESVSVDPAMDEEMQRLLEQMKGGGES
jgi:hypothetical protein